MPRCLASIGSFPFSSLHFPANRLTFRESNARQTHIYPADQILVPPTMTVPCLDHFQALETREISLYPDAGDYTSPKCLKLHSFNSL